MIKLIAEFSTTNRAGQRGAVWFAPKGWTITLHYNGHFSADNGDDAVDGLKDVKALIGSLGVGALVVVGPTKGALK